MNSENENVIYFKDDSGNGIMTCYKVLPGVKLIFSDFHMKQCDSQVTMDKDLFCIDHCREGRIEQKIVNETYVYMNAGDMYFDTREKGERYAEFPSCHYHGISLCFELAEAIKGTNSYVEGFPVDILELKRKFCENASSVFHEDVVIQQIFESLYNVPSKIRLYWYRTKVLELLLYLSVYEFTDEQSAHAYFYKEHVEKTKAIHTLMTENLTEHFTLEVLSKKYNFPITAMTKCFKSIYGDSIFAYMREYRINKAAALLHNDKSKSVLEIALMMGYESPGKFSTAFKSIMGYSPLKYRKKTNEMDKNN